ncbi:hypothetical protein PAPHI01_1355 [Pancytospora philotis]|nr:hypothetical protein PAPHI01_1355 [Pancytospora philotis]
MKLGNSCGAVATMVGLVCKLAGVVAVKADVKSDFNFSASPKSFTPLENVTDNSPIKVKVEIEFECSKVGARGSCLLMEADEEKGDYKNKSPLQPMLTIPAETPFSLTYELELTYNKHYRFMYAPTHPTADDHGHGYSAPWLFTKSMVENGGVANAGTETQKSSGTQTPKSSAQTKKDDGSLMSKFNVFISDPMHVFLTVLFVSAVVIILMLLCCSCASSKRGKVMERPSRYI